MNLIPKYTYSSLKLLTTVTSWQLTLVTTTSPTLSGFRNDGKAIIIDWIEFYDFFFDGKTCPKHSYTATTVTTVVVNENLAWFWFAIISILNSFFPVDQIT